MVGVMSILESGRNKRTAYPATPGRGILDREEIRALLGDAGIGLAFESDARDSGRTVSDSTLSSGWEIISREVYGGQGQGSGTVVETSIMHVNRLGSLVRCVTYPDGEPSRVDNVVMEFVPGFNALTCAGRACRLD